MPTVNASPAGYGESWPTERLSTIGIGGRRGRAWTPRNGYADRCSSRVDVYVVRLLACVDHTAGEFLVADQREVDVAAGAVVATADARRSRD
jgi:hypothetical protein